MHVDRPAGRVLANEQAVTKIAVALVGLLALMLIGWSGGDVHGAPTSPRNIDFVVNQRDLDDWRFYSESYGFSSVYDPQPRGLTTTNLPFEGYRVAKIRKYW